MNCVNCNEQIPPTFVAAIKENKCPACGRPCLSEKEHAEIFSVVANITTVVTDINADAIIKMAVAMHGKFDIFPKGVVVDNQVAKEVIYVTAAPQAPVYHPHTGFAPPPPPQPYAPPLKPTMRPGSPQAPAQQQTFAPPQGLKTEQMQRMAQLVAEFENQDEDDGIVTSLTQADLDLEQQRKTRELMNKHRRDKGGK